MDGLFDDPYIREFLLDVSNAWYSWEDNTEQMYSGDYLLWILNTLDAKLTGEHNSAVIRQKYPKRKPKPGNEIRSFAKLVPPPRWKSVIDIVKNQEAKQVAKQKDRANSMVDNIIREARRGTQNQD